jgi:uncharacterized protein
MELGGGLELRIAFTTRERLLGLAGLPALPRDVALLIPWCRSVHLLGMRFPVDLVFVDVRGRPLEVRRSPERRVAWRPDAWAVIEARAGEGERFAAALRRLRAGQAGSRVPTAPAPR